METAPIGVFGSGELLHRLQRECPGRAFTDARDVRETARISVFDVGADRERETPAKCIVRLVLHDGSADGTRRRGDIRVNRSEFLQKPDEYLAVATDLAEAVIHAAGLEQEVEYLAEIQSLMSLTDANTVSSHIVREVLKILDLSEATLFLHDPRLERYVVSHSTEPESWESEEFLPGIPADLLQKSLASGERFAFDTQKDGTGLIVMPLQVEDDLVGVIRVPVPSGRSIDADARINVGRYLAAVTKVLGNVYQLTRSRDLAMRDDLTKAFNRRFFETYLDEEIERSRRYNTLFSIIFLDLDDLKMVNNFYGHLTGSRTLQEVAKRILAAVRGIDKVVRFGGDEFCIILPQTDQEQAIAVANRVRKSMTATSFRLEPEIEISITASFGIATYPIHAMTKDGLIRQADAAMYRVKSTTKNAVGMAVVEDATKPASA